MPIYEYACRACEAALRDARAPLRRGGRLPVLRERGRREAALGLRGGVSAPAPSLRGCGAGACCPRRAAAGRPLRRRGLPPRTACPARPSTTCASGRGAPRRAAAPSGASASTREGKLTARERVELLLDAGTLRGARHARRAPLPRLRHGRARRSPATASSPGYGTRRRPARSFVFAQDFTVFGGSLSEANAAEDLQGHGPRDEERRARRRPQRLGRRAHPGGRRLARRLRRHLPAQHARLGRRAADLGDHGAVRGRRRLLARRSPTSSSWSRTRRYMFVTGPDVIKTVTHEEVTKEELGGAHDPQRDAPASPTSPPTTTAPASRSIRELLSYLPSNNLEDPPRRPTRRPRRPRGRRRSTRSSPPSRTSPTT